MTFGLVQAFSIDDGSIGDVSKTRAFTLGVEWGMTWEKAKSPAPFSITIHAENVDRISAMLIQQGRRFVHAHRCLSTDYIELAVSGMD